MSDLVARSKKHAADRSSDLIRRARESLLHRPGFEEAAKQQTTCDRGNGRAHGCSPLAETRLGHDRDVQAPPSPAARGSMTPCDFVIAAGTHKDWLSRSGGAGSSPTSYFPPATTRERDLRELLLASSSSTPSGPAKSARSIRRRAVERTRKNRNQKDRRLRSQGAPGGSQFQTVDRRTLVETSPATTSRSRLRHYTWMPRRSPKPGKVSRVQRKTPAELARLAGPGKSAFEKTVIPAARREDKVKRVTKLDR